jgi:glycosyltransferase involved in cell wall biosynthesis
MNMHVFSSTIIPTIGRNTLSRAVCSVLEQTCTSVDFEVIVVNDSGQPLAEEDWQHDDRVRVVQTFRQERCVARNTGAAVAKGRYLNFLDDDDTLLPEAIETWWTLAQSSNADWIYGAYRTVDNAGNLVEVIRPEVEGDLFALLVAGEGIPLQASVLKVEAFNNAGGFDTAPSIVGVEDRDLGRRLSYSGSVAYAPTLVAEIRIGIESSTTDWSKIAERDRLSRNKALSIAGAYSRLRVSTRHNYWRGRVCRAYLASAFWNLKRKQLASSAAQARACLGMGGTGIADMDFWKGFTKAE